MESSFDFLISVARLRDALEPFDGMPFAYSTHVMAVSEVEGVTFISTRNIPAEHASILPRFAMALHIRPEAFQSFHCRHNVSLKLNFLELFDHLLIDGYNDDIVAVSNYRNRLQIDCHIISPGLNPGMRALQIPLALRIGGPPTVTVSMFLPELEYVHEVKVGIPSIRFQQLFANESLDTRLLVYFSITNTEVSVHFNGAMRGVFTTEGVDRCLIEGPIGEDPFHFTFGAFSTTAVTQACNLSSNMVWLLAQFNGPSVLLRCPVPSLGSFFFYHYDSSHWWFMNISDKDQLHLPPHQLHLPHHQLYLPPHQFHLSPI